MKCTLCGKPALTQSNGKGYCKAHREESKRATISLGDKATGNGFTIWPRKEVERESRS